MKQTGQNNIFWQETGISLADREKRQGHKSACVWFTGLSGSGKSTLAANLEKLLFDRGINVYTLDGDNLRHGLNKDLGFSLADRDENIRRIGEAAKVFVDAGFIVLATFISPMRSHRDMVRGLMPTDKFIEIYVKCSLETCEQRDPKGLYKKARANLIKDFTGISSPYEEPLSPELVLENVHSEQMLKNVDVVHEYLRSRGLVL